MKTRRTICDNSLKGLIDPGCFSENIDHLLLRVLATLARHIISPVALANLAVWVRSLLVPYSFSVRVVGSDRNGCLRVAKFGQVCKMSSVDWGLCPHRQMGVSN
ncbi:hypothetical protein PoB_000016700 [Plakobranchus ocellatus]|uniref:Uncharacterized protein n=1 Tax=Plakobranchus ocellatus TaxID=259542 RepID=A0AAV3XTX4_9GAST|nr:hypothetical protein PoB_000016700 [Plakobranchus ocellatus]